MISARTWQTHPPKSGVIAKNLEKEGEARPVLPKNHRISMLPQIPSAQQGERRGCLRRHLGHTGVCIHVCRPGVVRVVLPDRRLEAARKSAAEEEVVRCLEGGVADGAPCFLPGEDGFIMQSGTNF
jgi:hypothetical protein